MIKTTEQIESAIAEANGNVRGALHAALAQRDLATALLKTEQERNTALLDALETIRALAQKFTIPAQARIGIVDKIACAVLRILGQIPMNTTEED